MSFQKKIHFLARARISRPGPARDCQGPNAGPSQLMNFHVFLESQLWSYEHAKTPEICPFHSQETYGTYRTLIFNFQQNSESSLFSLAWNKSHISNRKNSLSWKSKATKPKEEAQPSTKQFFLQPFFK